MVVVRARYEGGVLKPLEPLDLKEGEEVVVVVVSDARRLFGVVKRRRRVDEEELNEVIREIEDEGVL
ncbi:MAG: antitoxin family protein [Thermoproteus sp.]